MPLLSGFDKRQDWSVGKANDFKRQRHTSLEAMLSLKLFFVGLLVCGALAVEGSSRTLRLNSRRSAQTGEETNTASFAAPQTTSPSSRSTLRTEEIVVAPELDNRKTSSLLRQREGGRLSALLSRGSVDSLSITRDTPGSQVVLLSEDPSRTTKIRSIDGKNIVTNLRKSKPNSTTFTPELNSLDASEKEIKLISRNQKVRGRESAKHFGRFRTRRVTKELREFWERLDQRELSNQTDNLINTTEDSRVNSNLDSGLSKNLSETNGTEVNNTVFEEFPFLSENYDYNYYYYEDEEIHTNSSSNASLGKRENETNQAKPVPLEFLVQEQSEINKQISNNSNSRKPNSTENVGSKTISESRDSLSKKLTDNMALAHMIQARMMPELTAQSSRRIAQISPGPLSIPVTASDSFRSRRQNDSERDTNRPRDILKEFPIFRQVNKNQTVEESNRKTLSLHERLLHLTSRQSFVSTTTSIPITIGSTTTVMSPETSTLTTSTRAILPTMPLSTTTTTNIDLITMSQELPETSPVHRRTLEIRLVDTQHDTGLDVQEQPEVTLKNSTDSTNGTQQIHRNVTFSTSKTHKIAQTSPSFTIANPIVFESQLGIAPLGEAPFGVAPFGEIPMGEKPFGLLPQGISPLGNLTSEEENTTETNANAAEGVDGRYHVQVTGPDGSINGDYIVVDPVTGDVNGVRYEAAHDVDPLLVQRALLNFLSLDPRLSPAGTSTANVEDNLDSSTSPPDTTEADVTVDVDVATIEVHEKTIQTDIELETGPSEIIESTQLEPLPAQSSLLITEMPEPTVTPGAIIAEPTEPPEMPSVLAE